VSPNKTDVLQFLDKSSAPPAKYVRATMAFSASDKPYLEEYMVGPLPASNATTIQPLKYPFNSNVPGKTIIPRYLISDLSGPLAQFWSEVEDITKKLWNTVSRLIHK
jgi:primary-amine oxidase